MKLAVPALALLSVAAAAAHGGRKRDSQHQRQIRRTDVIEEERDLSVGASNVTDVHEFGKRQSFTGRGTFYYTGLGACGQYSKDSDYMVALNSAQYGGGYPGPQCFKYITVQANGVTVGGVQILDECPTCDWGGLDLSPGLFNRFASESAGVIQLTWWFDGSSPQPSTTTSTWEAPSSTSTWTPPSSSTSQWVAPSTSSSTWSAPPSSSSSAWTSTSMASSTISSASSSSWSSSASFNASANPFVVASNYNATSISASATATASGAAASGDNTTPISTSGDNNNVLSVGNLAAINGLVANYGQIVVVAAQGGSS